MSWNAIANEIKSILDTVKGAQNSRLQEVYNYDAPDADTGYPYATLGDDGAEESSLDTMSNQAIYNFVIRVVDVNKDKSAMVVNMRKVVDDIMAELRKREHITLGGTVDRFLPFVVSWGWESTNQVPTRICEIKISVLKDFTI